MMHVIWLHFAHQLLRDYIINIQEIMPCLLQALGTKPRRNYQLFLLSFEYIFYYCYRHALKVADRIVTLHQKFCSRQHLPSDLHCRRPHNLETCRIRLEFLALREWRRCKRRRNVMRQRRPRDSCLSTWKKLSLMMIAWI